MHSTSPCVLEGYEVGDRFVVIQDGATFAKDSIIELLEDDGTRMPMFKGVDCLAKDKDTWAYADLDWLEKIEGGVGDSSWYGNNELPPIGTVCEYVTRSGKNRKGIITHHTTYAAVIEYDNGGFDTGSAGNFAPVPTEEDIREQKAIEDMIHEFYNFDGAIGNDYLKTAEYLIKNGWRKSV